ncbi:hypothetical protein ABZZ80_02450 [Streptomyces sp. NPDC006356]
MNREIPREQQAQGRPADGHDHTKASQRPRQAKTAPEVITLAERERRRAADPLRDPVA